MCITCIKKNDEFNLIMLAFVFKGIYNGNYESIIEKNVTDKSEDEVKVSEMQ